MRNARPASHPRRALDVPWGTKFSCKATAGTWPRRPGMGSPQATRRHCSLLISTGNSRCAQTSDSLRPLWSFGLDVRREQERNLRVISSPSQGRKVKIRGTGMPAAFSSPRRFHEAQQAICYPGSSGFDCCGRQHSPGRNCRNKAALGRWRCVHQRCTKRLLSAHSGASPGCRRTRQWVCRDGSPCDAATPCALRSAVLRLASSAALRATGRARSVAGAASASLSRRGDTAARARRSAYFLSLSGSCQRLPVVGRQLTCCQQKHRRAKYAKVGAIARLSAHLCRKTPLLARTFLESLRRVNFDYRMVILQPAPRRAAIPTLLYYCVHRPHRP